MQPQAAAFSLPFVRSNPRGLLVLQDCGAHPRERLSSANRLVVAGRVAFGINDCVLSYVLSV
eukprot:3042729-Pleurochrysis_carterae.AAC.6